MTNYVKSVPTNYKGQDFRSRLEARWAVFFDSMSIDWVYEPEGYVLHNEEWYVPDFYLPQFETWVEVKGQFGFNEFQTAVAACEFGGALPNLENGYGTTRGLLYLGNIPRTESYGKARHLMFTHYKGVVVQYAEFNFVDWKPSIEIVQGNYSGEGHSALDFWEGQEEYARTSAIRLSNSVIMGETSIGIQNEVVKRSYQTALNYKFF